MRRGVGWLDECFNHLFSYSILLNSIHIFCIEILTIDLTDAAHRQTDRPTICVILLLLLIRLSSSRCVVLAYTFVWNKYILNRICYTQSNRSKRIDCRFFFFYLFATRRCQPLCRWIFFCLFFSVLQHNSFALLFNNSIFSVEFTNVIEMIKSTREHFYAYIQIHSCDSLSHCLFLFMQTQTRTDD